MGQGTIRRQKIDLNRLSEIEKRQLSRQLFQTIFSQIWKGFDDEQFYRYFFAGTPPLSKLYLFTKDHELIAYLIVKFVHIDIQKRKFSVFRISANVLPQYIGNKLVTWPVFVESFKCFIRGTFSSRKPLIFFTSNSPASYCATYKRTRKIYPNPDSPCPEKILKLLPLLAEQFNLDVDKNSPYVCTFKGIELISPYIAQLQDEDDSKAARFYKQLCPEYSTGQALITLLPLDFVSGVLESMHQVRQALWRKVMKRLHTSKKTSSVNT